MAEKHMFFGGNTPDGFYSYYDNILNSNIDKRLFILKGGPGVGKSSFIRTVASFFKEKGYDIEYLHCSGDINSLDGITIPKIGVGIIDGTAPHLVDPKIPAVFDEIINLGLYLNEEQLISYKEEIKKANNEKARHYKSAYKYLKAAQIIDQDSIMAYEDCLDQRELYEITNTILKRTLISSKEGLGSIRHMFASAITPEGSVSYVDSLVKGTKIVALKGETTISKKILEKVCEKAIISGYHVEACYCPMYPEKIEHLIIPELNISIVSLNKYHNCTLKATMEIEVDRALEKEKLISYLPNITKNTVIYEQLLNRAYESIKQAKDCHLAIEKYYIAAMDFDSVTLEREVLISRIVGEEA